jgi:hypothetical protein
MNYSTLKLTSYFPYAQIVQALWCEHHTVALTGFYDIRYSAIIIAIMLLFFSSQMYGEWLELQESVHL